MNGDSNTQVIWWCLGRNGKTERLSENREWRRICDVERQVVPDGGTRNRKRPPADCRETNGQNFQTMRAAIFCSCGETLALSAVLRHHLLMSASKLFQSPLNSRGLWNTLPQNVTSLTVLRKTHLFSYSFHQSPFAPAQWLCHFGHLYSRTLP